MAPKGRSVGLKLTAAQRQKLLAGECPGIAGTGACPVVKGDTIHLTPKFSLTVLRVDRAGRDISGWKLHYEVVDKRDPVRLLRRTPPQVVPRGEERPGEDEVKRASRESNYTSSPRSSVPGDAGEAVDPQTQARFVADAKLGQRAQQERERRERQSRRLDERLRNVQAVADRKGIDLTRKLRRVEDAVEAAERQVGREDA